MKWLKRSALGLVVMLVVVIGGMYTTGNGAILTLLVGYTFGKPSLPFDPSEAVPAPDYADPANWAALPLRDDLADLVPEGVVEEQVQGSAPVDVFFIHPTGFLKGSSWTFSMDPNTSTEENTSWMMANQASVYNGCCNVYAPRYRQASIYAYFSDDEVRDEVLAFAYQDVERAFQYYLDNYNQGRPFIIASHSQGTHHGARLLKDKIDRTALVGRMVAAYLIGGGIKQADIEKMVDINVCRNATDVGCVVHWDTFNVADIEKYADAEPGILCVNPLSWELNGSLAGKELHKGAVPGSGEFHLDIMGDDTARGVQFGPLRAPLPNFVEAQCANGRLFISDQSETAFGAAGAAMGTYHGLDYPMFHMDIRENAKVRTAIWQQPPAADFE